ncbi:MAG: hypothetical protein ACREA5_01930, partial [Nitrosotalea sp.]
MTINSKISLAVITFLTVSFMAATAQTPITVTTDKTTYSDGDTITISGTVADQLNIPISIIIRDSNQAPVYIAQTNPKADNTYSTPAIAGGDLWKTVGTYEIDVTYGGSDKTSKTTFSFTPNSQPASNATQQTNAGNVTVPEFGPLSAPIFAIAILSATIILVKA